MTSPLSNPRLLALVLWLAALVAFVAASVETSRTRLADELEVTGRTLHRLISQRVAQHDAHLTTLIALSSGAEPAPDGAVRQVMESISRFYPRIAWLALVSLGPEGAGAADGGAAEGASQPAGITAGAETEGSGAAQPAGVGAGSAGGVSVREVVAVPALGGVDLAPLAEKIAGQVRGRPSVYAAGEGRYLLAKRAPETSDLAVVLMIDATKLVEPEERPGFAHLVLSLDGKALVDLPADASLGSGVLWLKPPHFEKVIDGEGQRLLLSLDRSLPLAALVPPGRLLGFAVVAGLLAAALAFGLGQRAAVKRSLLAAREAEERLAVQERETLLAHASRVNAMGELASGIAHELTQPLTALLSRSQAALRLARAEKPDMAKISGALDVNVREAKRAGEMLKRMRDYASNKAPERARQDLNAIVAEVVALTRTDLERRGVALVLELTQPAPEAVVDTIEMEQVLHNLIRNAAEATGSGGVVTISTGRVGREAKIVVSDNGPGIAAEVLPKLFVPFFTTKADGMGLGLSLCATLVERVDGRIAAETVAGGGARFTVTLPLAREA
ncbi:HAMP domain-containing sensor histidine kinase [Aminobacter sp. AP02]|uniref:sensor histidine kinase n=1 Tax=Aminobacter sp. AP02 TaxID=2135737 RepID=UPI000D7A2653|nr:HAMP domain-containing sensor histidine kinase [Aminobacter sp. AP02]PWK60766.1 phospho-acceptor domain-containing protein [Aminobacter sp. AP02]